MLRPPIVLVALLLSAVFPASARAQGPPDAAKPPKRTDLPADDAIWGYGSIGGPYPVGGPKPLAAPIVPQDWLVVPRVAGDGIAELLARISDPKPGQPFAGDKIAGSKSEDAKWEARGRESLSDVTCAFTHIECDRDEVRMARLTGAGLLMVNGAGFVGDPERRGDRGVPVALHAGVNELYVFDIRGPFDLELWAPRTRTVLGTWDVRWPEAFEVFRDDLSFPVFNASLVPVTGLHVHYGEGHVEGGATRPALSEWRDGGHLLPLGLRMCGTYFIDPSDADPPLEDQPAVAPVCVYSSADEDADRQLLRWPGKGGRAANNGRHGNRREENLLGTPLARVGLHALLVWGTSSGVDRARFDQESIWYRAGYVPEAIQGKELLSLPPETQPDTIDQRIRRADNASRYVLYGNAETNEAWPHFVADNCPIQVHEGRLSLNGKLYTGDDICGWFLLKTAEYDDVLVLADTGARGVRLGYLVQPLFRRTDGLDYCFWDARGEGGTPREFASGKLPSTPADRRDR
jgi:hypothetical protein